MRLGKRIRCALEEIGRNSVTPWIIASKIRWRIGIKATLLKFGYGVTAVEGTYIENYMKKNAVEVKEDSMFVVNLEDDPKFFANLEMLAQKFCQDSVLLVPQGGEGAYLKGTNDSYPGLGKSEKVGSFTGGKEGEFMTLKIIILVFCFQILKLLHLLQ